jgi:two-component system, NarL family, response regulator LiaR
MAEPIRLLIADDHTLVRQGLCALMEEVPDVTVVGEATNGQEAVAQARTLRPDVIILDLVMPRKDGLEAIRDIKAENPEARILVLTSFTDDDKVLQAIKSGASGYLLKDSPAEDLLRAIRAVWQGDAYLSPPIAHKLMREFSAPPSSLVVRPEVLTRREAEVLDQIAQGRSNQEIAAALSISERTVSAHVSSLLQKLHLASRTQAALYALQREKDKSQHRP